MGASKTADMFKNEVLTHNPNIQIDVSAAPGFLSNWFRYGICFLIIFKKYF